MKKCIIIISVLLCLAGCGKKSEIINAELSQALSDNVSFTEKLTELDTTNAQRRYSLDSGDYTELAASVGTPATCDEFVIVKSEDTEHITEKLNAYLDGKKKDYAKYRPDEVSKLDTPFIETYNGTVVMIISGDTENAQTVYREYLKN